MQRLRRVVIGAVRWLLRIYLLLCGVLFFVQRSLLFHPVPAVGGGAVVSLDVDGVSLRIATRPHDGPRALLYFGGNAEDVSQTVPELAAAFPDRAIYALHYRGYGGSGGRPSEAALHGDAAAVFDDVAARHPEIDIIGRSLGSALATRLAATKPVRRLVLVTPFDSILAIAGRLFPWLPVRLLLADPFESVRDAPRVSVPTLVITAGRDDVVPVLHTRRLVEAFAPGIVTERLFPDAGHNDISLDTDYLGEMVNFLEIAASPPSWPATPYAGLRGVFTQTLGFLPRSAWRAPARSHNGRPPGGQACKTTERGSGVGESWRSVGVSSPQRRHFCRSRAGATLHHVPTRRLR